MDLSALPSDIITEITLQDPFIIPMLSCTCKQFNVLMRSRRLVYTMMRKRFPIKEMICLPKSSYVKIIFGDDFVTLALNGNEFYRIWIYKPSTAVYLDINPYGVFMLDKMVFSFWQSYMMYSQEGNIKDNMILQMARKIIFK